MTLRILLIEDNYTLRRLYARTLERDGLDVVQVETLAAARAALLNETFDAVVCDIQLTDGIATDFLVEIKVYGIPILAMSSDDNYRVVCSALGLNTFLQKPIPTRILAPEVRNAVTAAAAALT